MRTAFVYILKCSDGSYYVGSHRRTDVADRVGDHQHGKHRGAYTFTRRPVTLVWSDWFSRFDDAVAFERRVKGWSRKKKEALIKGDFDALQALAKRRGGNPRSDAQ
ncbi:MAG: GIY-YIG nuclease family protein [Pseudomonadota bacterium]